MPETRHALCRFPECATEIWIVQPGTPGPQYGPVPAHGGEIAILGRDASLHVVVERLLFDRKLRRRNKRQTHDGVFLMRLSPAEARNSLGSSPVGARVLGRVLNQFCDFNRVGCVDRVAGPLDLNGRAVGTLRVHALKIWIDDPVGPGHHVPARLSLPCCISERGRERGAGCEYLRIRLELSLLLREIGGKLRREPDRIDESVSIVRQTNRISTRRWKALAVFSLRLADIRR